MTYRKRAHEKNKITCLKSSLIRQTVFLNFLICLSALSLYSLQIESPFYPIRAPEYPPPSLSFCALFVRSIIYFLLVWRCLSIDQLCVWSSQGVGKKKIEKKNMETDSNEYLAFDWHKYTDCKYIAIFNPIFCFIFHLYPRCFIF